MSITTPGAVPGSSHEKESSVHGWSQRGLRIAIDPDWVTGCADIVHEALTASVEPTLRTAYAGQLAAMISASAHTGSDMTRVEVAKIVAATAFEEGAELEPEECLWLADRVMRCLDGRVDLDPRTPGAIWRIVTVGNRVIRASSSICVLCRRPADDTDDRGRCMRCADHPDDDLPVYLEAVLEPFGRGPDVSLAWPVSLDDVWTPGDWAASRYMGTCLRAIQHVHGLSLGGPDRPPVLVDQVVAAMRDSKTLVEQQQAEFDELYPDDIEPFTDGDDVDLWDDHVAEDIVADTVAATGTLLIRDGVIIKK